ncbi:MAG TPA: S8 family serine peptidase [Candidatus Polarisedimenticolia bacterium]|nr:S8 family serine peptidase [Candidatus Polarisedimenticolia bacterium]
MTCSLCGAASDTAVLSQASWLAPEVVAGLVRLHPEWRRADGACPACVQQALLQVLLARGDTALHEEIQNVWPLDGEAAFGVLPTPLRMHADPRYTGRGITMALVDSGFYPHADLTQPRNRIRAWVDAGSAPVTVRYFEPEEDPAWPGWDDGAPSKWHGLMTSAVAAGNGWLSHGLYRGLASEAEVVLVQAREPDGHISNESIGRALEWLRREGPSLDVRVISISLGGDPVPPHQDPLDPILLDLASAGVTVIVAAGNDGQRRLVPPATSPSALTIGGIDDKNTFDHDEMELWHGNYGSAPSGAVKPELVAPSIWVVAPLLPGSTKAAEAQELFSGRSEGDPEVESRIAAMKYVTPHYHHVDGTSVSAPLVAGVVACMLQANPALSPRLVRRVLSAAARPVPGAPTERQGAGALDAGQAVALALREQDGDLAGRPLSPLVTSSGVTFQLHDHTVRRVDVLGSWDDWRSPGLAAALAGPGLWQAWLPIVAPGRYLYKYLLDGTRWLDDPDNPHKIPDGFGRLNSLFTL